MNRIFSLTTLCFGLYSSFVFAQTPAPLAELPNSIEVEPVSVDSVVDLEHATVEKLTESDVGWLEFKYTDKQTGQESVKYAYSTEDDASSASSFGPPAIPPDSTTPPGPGWEWRPITEPIGGPNGGWYNPGTGETLHPDLDHPQPKGPHWGWRDPFGNKWDFFPEPPPGKWKPNPSHPNNPNKPQPTFPPGTEPAPIPTNTTTPRWLKLLRWVTSFPPLLS